MDVCFTGRNNSTDKLSPYKDRNDVSITEYTKQKLFSGNETLLTTTKSIWREFTCGEDRLGRKLDHWQVQNESPCWKWQPYARLRLHKGIFFVNLGEIPGENFTLESHLLRWSRHSALSRSIYFLCFPFRPVTEFPRTAFPRNSVGWSPSHPPSASDLSLGPAIHETATLQCKGTSVGVSVCGCAAGVIPMQICSANCHPPTPLGKRYPTPSPSLSQRSVVNIVQGERKVPGHQFVL